MRSVRFALSVLLPVLLLAHCADSGEVMAPPEKAVTPNFDPGATPPQTPGPNVHRGLPASVVLSDGSLVVVAGNLSAEEACEDPIGNQAPGAGQIVNTPPGGSHIIYTGHGLTLQVFEFAGEVTDLCQLIGAPLVASGTGTLKLRDNGTPGAEVVVHITVAGIVDLVSGGQARLFATAQFVGRGEEFALSRTRITLTPL
jgi:hypothetical protein